MSSKNVQNVMSELQQLSEESYVF